MRVVLGFLKAWRFEMSDLYEQGRSTSPTSGWQTAGGARISAAEIAAILERRRAIERGLTGNRFPVLRCTARQDTVPWLTLTRLFDAFADIRGVGFSKMTKALHPKRPALIPMLDSVVQAYLQDDDLGTQASFGERALALVRGYKRDWTATRQRCERSGRRSRHAVTG